MIDPAELRRPPIPAPPRPADLPRPATVPVVSADGVLLGPVRTQRECPTCGASFNRVGKKVYCSRPCKERAKARERQAVMKAADMGHEALRTFVGERDGWVCQLCGNPIDRSLIYPAPMSKSLDHTVPLARGGAHDPSNAQIAHLLCNQQKNSSSEDRAPRRPTMIPRRVVPGA